MYCLGQSVSREVENRKQYVTVCTYDKYWMRYDILKLEKFTVNKWNPPSPPPFGKKPKLDCLFVLIVVQLTLHVSLY